MRRLLPASRTLVSYFGAALLVVAATACKRGGGPHLQLVSPAGPGPSFGDAPNRSAESERGPGAGGGGGALSASQEGAGGGARAGTDVARIVGAAAGIGAGAVMLSTGMLNCKPGMDTLDAGALVNACSGEARAPMLGPSLP